MTTRSEYFQAEIVRLSDELRTANDRITDALRRIGRLESATADSDVVRSISVGDRQIVLKGDANLVGFVAALAALMDAMPNDKVRFAGVDIGPGDLTEIGRKILGSE